MYVRSYLRNWLSDFDKILQGAPDGHSKAGGISFINLKTCYQGVIGVSRNCVQYVGSVYLLFVLFNIFFFFQQLVFWILKSGVYLKQLSNLWFGIAIKFFFCFSNFGHVVEEVEVVIFVYGSWGLGSHLEEESGFQKKTFDMLLEIV